MPLSKNRFSRDDLLNRLSTVERSLHYVAPLPTGLLFGGVLGLVSMPIIISGAPLLGVAAGVGLLVACTLASFAARKVHRTYINEKLEITEMIHRLDENHGMLQRANETSVAENKPPNTPMSRPPSARSR